MRPITCFFISVYISFCLVQLLEASTIHKEDDDERRMHPAKNYAAMLQKQQQPVEDWLCKHFVYGNLYIDAEFWVKHAQESLTKKLAQNNELVKAEAKNIIFYLGDGMSVPTITASRILKGQKVDNLPFGEEGELYMDSFPYNGVSKTFCSDAQVADSACSATAYLCGSKANSGTAGVSPAVLRYNCSAQADAKNHVSSILVWAQAAGKSTGVITTTRITHASPSGTYAHIADRDWENDSKVKFTITEGDPSTCPDIAKQLIMNEPASKINVILGGGRRQFLPNTTVDIEEPKPLGYREDGLDLIQMWKDKKVNNTAKYITGRDELLKVDTAGTDYLLGLFNADHLAYYHEQEAQNDPSLEEMVQVAIQILSKNPKGFYLFVEGGRIDHAHHDNYIQRALWETIEFDKAIQRGDNMTDDKDTLIVVTSDHAHAMSIAGYPTRGNPITGIADMADDGLQYNTLSYANGPGPAMWVNGSRHDITGDNFESVTYRPPSPVDIYSETHGGDDVLIFSKGPYAHLLTGVQQQSYIPHVIAYAACIGDGAQHCKDKGTSTGAAGDFRSNSYLIVTVGIVGLLSTRI